MRHPYAPYGYPGRTPQVPLDAAFRPGTLCRMTLEIARICRYPVKGLSAENLDRVRLSPGLGLPDDRRFALAHGSTAFDVSAPAWMPKHNFLMLAKNERLAKLHSRYDSTTGILTIERDGKQVLVHTMKPASPKSGDKDEEKK